MFLQTLFINPTWLYDPSIAVTNSCLEAYSPGSFTLRSSTSATLCIQKNMPINDYKGKVIILSEFSSCIGKIITIDINVTWFWYLSYQLYDSPCTYYATRQRKFRTTNSHFDNLFYSSQIARNNKITYTVMINTPPKDSFKIHYCDIIIQLYHLSSVISFEMQLVGSPIDVWCTIGVMSS